MSVRLFDSLKIAWADMNRNSLRTALTMLGIVIGITAMISVFTVGEAGRERIQEELNNFGINRIWILPNGDSLASEDATYLNNKISGLRVICPADYKMAIVKYGNIAEECDIMGTTQSVTKVQKTVMEAGRHLTGQDIAYNRKVAVLTQKAKQQMFGEGDAVGKKLDIQGIQFLVIGVEKEMSQVYDQFFLGKCYIPITVYQSMFQDDELSEISVVASNMDSVDAIADKSQDLFAAKYGENSVKVINLSGQMDNANNIMTIFTLVIAAVAGVSLLVGGIGIMNIMLVTIRERTREIGIRKALGATQRDILMEFLFESLLYAVAGGIIGVIAGCFLTVVTANAIGLAVRLSVWPIAASVAFAAGIGLVFGILPAKRAARMNPVDALRQE